MKNINVFLFNVYKRFFIFFCHVFTFFNVFYFSGTFFTSMVTTTIRRRYRLRFHFCSIAILPRYDHLTTYFTSSRSVSLLGCRLLHWGINRYHHHHHHHHHHQFIKHTRQTHMIRDSTVGPDQFQRELKLICLPVCLILRRHCVRGFYVAALYKFTFIYLFTYALT